MIANFLALFLVLLELAMAIPAALSNCCEQLSAMNIMSCVQNFAGIDKLENDIDLVSYSSRSIWNYAAYTAFLASAYASIYGTKLILLDDLGNPFIDTRDERWNKIIILKRTLDQHPSIKYLIWIDADAIVRDFKFSFSDVVQKYGDFDLIVSSDQDIRNGLINTGCMILKNTIWTGLFLTMWWSRYDRADGMDQHVFDQLYYSNALDVRNHTAILAPNVINSYFPALVHLEKNLNVLHLAGESATVRAMVFKEAFRRVCGGEAANVLPSEALTRLDFQSQQEQELDVLLNQLRTAGASGRSELLHMTARVRDSVQFLGLLSQLHPLADRSLLVSKYLLALQALYAMATNILQEPKSEVQDRLSSLQDAINAGYDLLAFSATPMEMKESLLVDLESYVEELQRLVAVPSRGSALYYKFKVLQFLSDYQLVSGMSKEQMYSTWLRTYEVWQEMHGLGHHGAGNQLSDPFKEILPVVSSIGNYQCSHVPSASQSGLVLLQSVSSSIHRTWLARHLNVEPLEKLLSCKADSCSQRNNASSVVSPVCASARGIPRESLWRLCSAYLDIIECSPADRSRAHPAYLALLACFTEEVGDSGLISRFQRAVAASNKYPARKVLKVKRKKRGTVDLALNVNDF